MAELCNGNAFIFFCPLPFSLRSRSVLHLSGIKIPSCSPFFKKLNTNLVWYLYREMFPYIPLKCVAHLPVSILECGFRTVYWTAVRYIGADAGCIGEWETMGRGL